MFEACFETVLSANIHAVGISVYCLVEEELDHKVDSHEHQGEEDVAYSVDGLCVSHVALVRSKVSELEEHVPERKGENHNCKKLKNEGLGYCILFV